MRLHRIVTVVGLTALIGAPLVAPSSAMAWGGWGTGNVDLQLPPQLSPWPQVAQVPIFGGQTTFAQEPQPSAAPQTAQLPDGDAVNGLPTFIAPGVVRNANGQVESSFAQARRPSAALQTAQVPEGDAVNGSPTFVAPGVVQSASGQLESSY
jgi:hypothetical protein